MASLQRLVIAMGMLAAMVAGARASTFIVTSASDSGAGTLRQAILDANTSPGLDTITFAIGSGPQSIAVFNELPAITDPVIIDGYSQPGAQPNSAALNQADNAAVLIALDGLAAASLFGLRGLVIGNEAISTTVCSGTLVRGLAIGRFPACGIEVHSGGVRIEGNFIGTDTSATLPRGNLDTGIRVLNTGGIGMTIGGANAAARNIISANGTQNIKIDGALSSGTRVVGNFIGTNRQGTGALSNANHGVNIFGSAFNIVGEADAGNVISGNALDGIAVQQAGADDNLIQGNLIGTNNSGAAALANGVNGVEISQGNGNRIGGTATGAGNLLSGNGFAGINIFHSFGTQIQGNEVGLNLNGDAAVRNAGPGIALQQETSSTLIGGTAPGAVNFISGNGADGISIFNSPGNTISGNLIGTTVSGMAILANGINGIQINASANNTVGGTETLAGNLVSGNGFVGINLLQAYGTKIQGNEVGLNFNGDAPLRNVNAGIALQANTSNTLVGGTGAGAVNFISGNGQQGIAVLHSTHNTISGNLIGTTASGMAAMGNGLQGIELDHSPDNLIGGTEPLAGNLVSANALDGIFVIAGHNTQIQGNEIGLNLDGSAALGNGASGISLQTDTSSTLIGGPDPGARNYISGNHLDGITMAGGSGHNTVQGNYIGSTGNGLAPMGNVYCGIVMFSDNNMVGGPTPELRNIVGANGLFGVAMQTTVATTNTVQGNYIGLGADGRVELGNTGTTIGGTGQGVFVENASGNRIIGNVVSCSAHEGILFKGASNLNTVQGNRIGSSADGATARPNLTDGVATVGTSSGNMIGGLNAATQGNLIAYNLGRGVALAGGVSNSVIGNDIGGNGGLGIDLNDDGVTTNDMGDADNGPNNLQNMPTLTGASYGSGLTLRGTIDGKPNTPLHLEFFESEFRDPTGYGEGEVYIGTIDVMSDAQGHADFTANLPTSVGARPFFTATSTDFQGNTSEFSNVITLTAVHSDWALYR